MTDYLFATDGCSGGMSWVWKKLTGNPPPWESACIEHDRAYHKGGTRSARKAADLKLAADVTMSGHPYIAVAMYGAVRIGGHPLWPFPWRWGYGWKYPKYYT